MRKQLSILLSVLLASTILAGCSSGKTQTSLQDPSAPAPSGSTNQADVKSDGTVNNPEAVKTKLWRFSLLVYVFRGRRFLYGPNYFRLQRPNLWQPRQLHHAGMGRRYTKLTTAVAANKGPDIGVCHVSNCPSW